MACLQMVPPGQTSPCAEFLSVFTRDTESFHALVRRHAVVFSGVAVDAFATGKDRGARCLQAEALVPLGQAPAFVSALCTSHGYRVVREELSLAGAEPGFSQELDSDLGSLSVLGVPDSSPVLVAGGGRQAARAVAVERRAAFLLSVWKLLAHRAATWQREAVHLLSSAALVCLPVSWQPRCEWRARPLLPGVGGVCCPRSSLISFFANDVPKPVPWTHLAKVQSSTLCYDRFAEPYLPAELWYMSCFLCPLVFMPTATPESGHGS